MVSLTAIQLVLHFPDPNEFKQFAEVKAEETVARWANYDAALINF